MRAWLRALSFLVVTGCGPAEVDAAPPEPVAYSATLRAAAAAAGMQLGSFVDQPDFTGNPTYAATAQRELSAVTVGWSMKWVTTEPQRNVYDFSISDQVVARAIANGQQIKGHTLVWHVALPQWVFAPSNTFYQDMVNHITTEVTHFKGKVAVWDVLNEAFNSDGTLRNTIFLQKIGPLYINSAFTVAHQADPNALLYYNDYGIEDINAKSNAVYNLICGPNGLRAKGVPIHGIGMQTKISGPPPYRMFANIQRFRQCGLQVDVSEMAVTTSDLNLQRSIYWDVTRGCIYYGCRAVITGTLQDGATSQLLFDANLQPKPAYYGVLDALQGTYWRTVSSTLHDHSIQFLTYSTTSYLWENNGWGRFHLASRPAAGLKPIYLCQAGGWDHFLSPWSTCEGQQILGMYGYGYSAPGPGLVAINRCLLNADHFHSRHSTCEGFKVEGPIFYSP